VKFTTVKYVANEQYKYTQQTDGRHMHNRMRCSAESATATTV